MAEDNTRATSGDLTWRHYVFLTAGGASWHHSYAKWKCWYRFEVIINVSQHYYKKKPCLKKCFSFWRWIWWYSYLPSVVRCFTLYHTAWWLKKSALHNISKDCIKWMKNWGIFEWDSNGDVSTAGQKWPRCWSNFPHKTVLEIWKTWQVATVLSQGWGQKHHICWWSQGVNFSYLIAWRR